ncbi:MAG TPA: hypothetical protein VJA21_25710 [Verrucomicrobiae bacterium]
MPRGAKVTIECDNKEYLLGENVLLHFMLENASETPFEADFGEFPPVTKVVNRRLSARWKGR